MRGIKKIELVEVIKTQTVVGRGTKEDPVRTIIQYWAKDGKLIATLED